MLGGIFEKNDIKVKIQTFDQKITEKNEKKYSILFGIIC